jgi:predicted secreted hydrolase
MGARRGKWYKRTMRPASGALSGLLLLLALASCHDGARGEPCGAEFCGAGTFCNREACGPTAVVLPDDATVHPDATEWWYYTGHLVSGERRWGFQVTAFQADVAPGLPGFMCNVALTDETEKVHYHYDTYSFDVTVTGSWPRTLQVAECLFRLGGDGHDHLEGTIPDGAETDGHAGEWRLALDLDPAKRIVYHGGDGVITMGTQGGWSYYYSYTRLQARGTLATPAGSFDVTGEAWMDHQWGQFDMNEFKGWDWWSLQLDDGSEVMLFQFRDWNSQLVSQAATLVAADGTLDWLEALDDFTVTPVRTWASPHTDGVYPLDWDIAIPAAGLTVRLTTDVDDQEMWNPAQNYWEGPVVITGTRDGVPVTGQGYAELTGYATDPMDP